MSTPPPSFDATLTAAIESARKVIGGHLGPESDCSVIILDRDGCCVWWNEGARRLFGYAPEEVLGQQTHNLLSTPEDARAGLPSALLLIAQRRGRWEGTIERVGKDGHRHYVRMCVISRNDANGQHSGFLLVSRPETESSQSANPASTSSAREQMEANIGALASADPQGTLFKNLVQNALVGIQILQDGKYAYANEQLGTLFGYTPEELISLDSWTRVVAPEDREMVLDQIHRRENAEIPHAQYVFRGLRKDGSMIDVEVRSDRMELHGRPAVLGMLVDVSERRRAETILRESEERFRNAFDLTNVAMVLTDLDHRFVRANAAFSRMFGYSSLEILQLSMADITYPDDVAESYARRQPLLDGKSQFFQMEKRYLHKDGRVLWGLTNVSLLRDAHGQPRQYVGQVQDITERKRSEEVLRRNERRFRALIENGSDAILLLNRNGVIEYAGPSSSRVLGYAPEELTGHPLKDWLVESDQDRLQDCLDELLPVPTALETAEYRIVQSDKSTRWVEVTHSNLLHDLTLKSIVCNLRDITERKRLESQLAHAQKLESIGRLAGGVAHDFNNLLTIILGYGEMLADSFTVDDPRVGMLLEIQKAGERAAGLTRQLLAFSRRQVLEPQVVDLGCLVHGTESMLQRLIGEDIRLRTRITADMWPILADPGRLEQILLNLCVNARDAMPEGGTLSLETHNIQLDEPYLGVQVDIPPGKYAVLSVTDTGCGMNEETRSRLFEPFYTTKPLGQGTGLGLAVVYGIVKQSGGYIYFYSEPGYGTTFRIYFPWNPNGAPAPVATATAPQPVHGHETILLAEDEDSLRRLAANVLRRCGYTVLDASDGAEALKLSQEHEGQIQLLVTDVIMPGMSGRKLADQLLQERPDLKVLYMSGYTDDAVHQHDILASGVSFLHKPFTPSGLSEKVRQVLDQQPVSVPAV